MVALGSKKQYNKDEKRENNCDNCSNFIKRKGMQSAHYGRCLATTMYDTRSDGTVVIETGRPAARFDDDICEKHSKGDLK